MNARVVVVAALAALAALASSCDCSGGALTSLHAVLAADTNRIDFGGVYLGASKSLRVRVTSAGTKAVAFDDPRARIDGAGDGGGGGADFSFSSSLGASLAPGESADIDVVFTPAGEGPANARLAIASDAENAPLLDVELVGQGLAPLDCDDHEDCTDDVFDAATGLCRNAPLDGAACDDHSACTQNDRCAAGVCLGDAIECHDDVACTRDVCDPAAGCAFIPDDTSCADDDPCSIDVCNAQLAGSGCTHAPAPDGHPCGDLVQCDSLLVCVSQVCTPFQIPDGAPCSDGDICTTGDQCAGGACVGVQSVNDPVIVSETLRFLSHPHVALVGGAVVAGDVDVKVGDVGTPAATLAGPTAHVPEAARAFALAAEPLGTRAVALTQVPAHGARTGADVANAHMIIVDVAAPNAPAFERDIDLGAPPIFTLAFGGFQISHEVLAVRPGAGGAGGGDPIVFACIGPLDQHARIAIADIATGDVAAVVDADDLCGLRIVSPAVDGTRGDLVLAQTRVYRLDDVAGAVLVANVAEPAGFPVGGVGFNYLDDARGVLVSNAPNHPVLIVDLRDLQDVTSVLFDPASEPALGADAVVLGVKDHFIYFGTDAGLRRVDVDDASAPFVDPDWRTVALPVVNADSELLAIDAQHAIVAFDAPFGDTTMVRLDVRRGLGVVAGDLLGGQGTVGNIVDDGDAVVTMSRDWLGVIRDDALTNNAISARATGLPQVAIVARGDLGGAAAPGAARGLYTAAATLGDDLRGLETGALPIGYTSRVDGRAEIDPPFDPNVVPFRFSVDDEFNPPSITFDQSFSVVFPAGVASYAAAAGEGCTGAALSREPNQRMAVTTLSLCDPNAAILPISTVDVPTLGGHAFAPFTPIVSGPDSVTFAADDVVVVVDLNDPLNPAPLSVDMPDLVNDAWVSAGYDTAAAALVVIESRYAGDAHATLVALAGVTSSVAATWEIAGGDDVRRRVLAVQYPRAYVSDHDVGEAPERGWSVVAWDISANPPAVSDRLPIASEPVDMILHDDRLIVARSDGISVITPPCGPP